MFSGTLTLSSSMEVLYRTDSSPAKVCRGTRMAGKTKISCADKRLREYRKNNLPKFQNFKHPIDVDITPNISNESLGKCIQT